MSPLDIILIIVWFFPNLSDVVVFYNCICVLKVNKIKWLDEEQILNYRFFGTNFWEEFSKNQATLKFG